MPIAERLFGWYVGLTIAFVLIVVVVAVVASILTLAQRISEQVPLAAEGLRAVADNTSAIPAILAGSTTIATQLDQLEHVVHTRDSIQQVRAGVAAYGVALDKLL